MFDADRLPHALEDAGRAGEVHAGEVLACERGVADLRAGAVDEVDHAVGQAGLLQQLHQEVRGVGRGRRGLPDDGVPHQRGARREVAADRGEVERRHREDEAFERAVLQPVPDAGRGDGLLLVDARHVADVEAPEVGELAGGVDLRLVRGLRLAEHRRGVERGAPRAGEQVGRAKQHGRALFPRRARPVVPRGGGRVDRLLHVRGVALRHLRQDVSLVVRHHLVERLGELDVLAADHERYLDLLPGELRQPDL